MRAALPEPDLSLHGRIRFAARPVRENPIGEALLARSVPICTVLALMMSVAAISLPEMMILRKVLRPPMLMLFAGYLAVAFTGVGYLFNALV